MLRAACLFSGTKFFLFLLIGNVLISLRQFFQLFAMVDPVVTITASSGLKVSEVLTFISSLVTALAWPISAFLIVNLFKNEIIERIPRLSELTLPGGISAKFNKDLEKVEAVPTDRFPVPAVEAQIGHVEGDDVMSVSAEASPPVPKTIQPAGPDQAALRANPNGTVMEAWVNLELALREMGQSAPQPVVIGTKYGAAALVGRLRTAGIISSDEELKLHTLLELRNLAAHAQEKISEDGALRFKEIADSLAASYRDIAAVSSAMNNPPAPPTPARSSSRAG